MFQIKEIIIQKLRNALKQDFFRLQNEISILRDELQLANFKNSSTQPNIVNFWANRNISNDFWTDEVFIIGSGESLLQLTKEEIRYISRKASIAMNKYILYWDIIGIWPTFSYLADSLGVGKKVFLLIQKQILIQEQQFPILLLDKYFEQYIHPKLPVVFFDRNDSIGTNLNWARSLQQPLFFHVGSLTSLLNLVSVLRIAPKIKLIGVDLNTPHYFYHEHEDRYFGLINPWDMEAKKRECHATVANLPNWGSILDYWELINRNLKEDNVEVYSCNEHSLLLEMGLVKYCSVIY